MDASSVFQDTLPMSSDALLVQLSDWGLAFVLHEHVPLRTVEDAKVVEAAMDVEGQAAFRVKNLYLRDKKKRNYLVVLDQDRVIDLKTLGAQLGVGGLSFGSADRLMQNLGVRPGAVTPLAMINGAENGVRLILDGAARRATHIYMHPLVNDRTIAMPVADLLRFFEKLDVTPEWLDLEQA